MTGDRMNQLSDNEIREYGKMVSILANRMISNKDVAQEAAQEVWIEILEGLPSFRGDSKLSTWIYAVGKRVISKYATNEYHHSIDFLHDFLSGDDRVAPDFASDVEKNLWIKKECDRCLTGLFHCLTNDARMVYLFRDVAQLSYNEISRIMEMDEQHIRKTVSRSRAKRLRKRGTPMDAQNGYAPTQAMGLKL